MRGESHRRLGKHLAEIYMHEVPDRYIRAFLLGCIEPDRNPATYLKGSFRCQWLRGHNYPNTKRFLQRIARRLETKKEWKLLDFYTLGKLIHYIADSFTYAHNERFSGDLAQHRSYEMDLQEYFLPFLESRPIPESQTGHAIMDTLAALHRKYLVQEPGVKNDARFVWNACCCAMDLLFTREQIFK